MRKYGLPYVENLELHRMDGVVVKDPAILVDGDVFLKYGEIEDVRKFFNAHVEIFKATRGKKAYKKGECKIDMVDLGNLSKEDACYIISRGIAYTATGFLENLRCKYKCEDFQEWLEEERKLVEIKVSK